MATHHVDLRRACPAPFGQLTASPGELSSKTTLAQARRTSSRMRYCFYPWERLTTERPNSIEIGKVQVSYKTVLSHERGNGNGTGKRG
jgi:hypothetical protein